MTRKQAEQLGIYGVYTHFINGYFDSIYPESYKGLIAEWRDTSKDEHNTIELLNSGDFFAYGKSLTTIDDLTKFFNSIDESNIELVEFVDTYEKEKK